MSLSGSEATIHFQVPYSARAAWTALREAAESHPSIVHARCNDLTMRAELRTVAPNVQSITATVTPNGYSTLIEISSTRPGLCDGDKARICRVANELRTEVSKRVGAPGSSVALHS